MARHAFTAYADRVHPGLGEWMNTNTRFPNSMVDRITPVTTPDVIAVLDSEFGVQDQWPVAAEPFTSWVLEDSFSDGRLSVDPGEHPRIDVHISGDPVATLLVVYKRRSQWPSILTGRLAAWGRKPWVAFRLTSYLVAP